MVNNSIQKKTMSHFPPTWLTNTVDTYLTLFDTDEAAQGLEQQKRMNVSWRLASTQIKSESKGLNI